MRTTPTVSTVLALVVAVLAVSSSGAMIAYAAAPALAIAFWRNTMAVGVLAPAAVLRRRDELAAIARGPARREGLICVLAGVALAAHFMCWVPSVKLTTVAMATALGATQPVWQGLIAVAQGRRPRILVWVGIAVSVVGAVLATGADLGVSRSAVAGDLLAVAGGLAAAVYTALGERVRTAVSTTSYTTICYAVCSVVILVVCLGTGVPLHGYPTTAWLALLGLTVGPQLLGHSLFNFALNRVSATTIAVLILLEVPGATVIGWAWLGQVPRAASWPGLALLIVGVAIVVVAGGRPRTGVSPSRREPARLVGDQRRSA